MFGCGIARNTFTSGMFQSPVLSLTDTRPTLRGRLKQLTLHFSGSGIGLQYAQGWGIVNGIPYAKVEESIQYHDPAESAKRLLRLTGRKKPDFLYFRTILMTHSEHKKMFDQVKSSQEG